jgi:MoaA/NifB/PqqE/SkfB family radical SAM enzyme
MATKKLKNFKNNLPYAVIRVGTKCNANCLFCNIPSESFSLAVEVPISRIKKEIRDLSDKNKNIRISLSGGEPTVREDLPKIIEFAKRNGVRVVEIQTNALLSGNIDYARKLKKAGLDKAFVSFHSQIPRTQNFLLKKKGAYEKCLQGIRNLLGVGIEVNLNPVITTKNYKSLPGYIDFVKKKIPGITSISLSVVQPRGRARDNKKIVPRYKHLDPYVKSALGIGEKLGIIINNPYCGLPLCIGEWWQHLDRCVEFSENYIKIKQNITSKNNRSDKVKSETCLLCDLEKFCNGVWREYAQLYSLKDMKPVSLPKNALKLYYL